jgi:predicted 3-demethylubiquinone-9 3-methyltransferase (glyoxalase superfamily)
MKNSIVPCLWFNGNANEAAQLYCSAFPEAEIKNDTPMVVTFHIQGKQFIGLNGGPNHKPNPSISFFYTFKSEAELTKAWSILSAEGKVMMALDSYPWSSKYGWLEDKFGVSWQLSLATPTQNEAEVFPSLMFTKEQNGKAQQAIDFYTAVFPNSYVALIAKYEPGEGDTVGNIKHAQFNLNGYKIAIMESSMVHEFQFDWGVSLSVSCDTQEEIDHYWNKLTECGQESMCGWCQDRFGLWWQIVPSSLGKYMTDPAKAPRVMEAFMKMSKFNIAEIEEAAS